MSFSRVDFQDGIVYHDYHFNGMQLEIAKEIKRQDVLNYYDLCLISSPYNYSFVDQIVDKSRSDEVNTTCVLDYNSLVVTTPSFNVTTEWQSVIVSIPAPTSEVLLLLRSLRPSGTSISCYISEAGVTWINLSPGVPRAAVLSGFKLRFVLQASVDQRPQIQDYCLLWR